MLDLTSLRVYSGKAEAMFLKALGCEANVVPKAMMNLGLVYQMRANSLASSGDLVGAKRMAVDSVKYIDGAKPLLDTLKASGSSEADEYIAKYGPLRLQGYRLMGQLHAGMKDYEACEKKFREATEVFPNEPTAWQMLYRILELQGMNGEAQAAMDKAKTIMNQGSTM
jgi:tetratricopeptide (TPR) repeat protein